MSITGIICEYNPFHNGHAYHIEQTKSKTGDSVLCLMSGPFVQRGEPAIQSAQERAKNAVQNGADLVTLLPFVYACAPAATFALGAIKMLNAIKGLRFLSFGIEKLDWDDIRRIADLLYDEPPALSTRIKNGLNRGLSFPRAQAEAVADLCGLAENPLDYPNNTLAIEYLRALRLGASSIEPLPIRRIGDGYAAPTPNDAQFASATAIRGLIERHERAERYLPASASADFVDPQISRRNYYLCLRAKLLAATPERIRETADCVEGLEYRILDAAAANAEYEAFVSCVKTKRYTRARINRVLTSFLVDVRASDIENALAGEQLYRVPAFRDTATLNAIPLSVLTVADADKLGFQAANILRIERRADRIHRLVSEAPISEYEWFKTVKAESERK